MAQNPIQQQVSKFSPKGSVRECVGSVLNPEYGGLKLILAVTSQSGKYSSPSYDALGKRWVKVRTDYREAFVNQQDLKLGKVNTSPVNSDAWVAQAVCLDKKEKLDKDALTLCIQNLIKVAKDEKGSVHVSSELLDEVKGLSKLLPLITEAGINIYLYKAAE